MRVPHAGVDLLAALAGFGLIVYGIGIWSRPAGFVTAGALLLIGALWRRA